MEKSKIPGLLFGGIQAVFSVLAFIVLIQHEKEHDKTDYTEVSVFGGLIIVGLILSVLSVLKNLKDAKRADGLKAQIVTLKDEHKTQMKELERQHAKTLESSHQISADSTLTIQSAWYGVGNHNDVDVAEFLRSLPKTGICVQVGNNLIPGISDPAHGQAKRLSVNYSYGFLKNQECVRNEYEQLILPEDVGVKQRTAKDYSVERERESEISRIQRQEIDQLNEELRPYRERDAAKRDAEARAAKAPKLWVEYLKEPENELAPFESLVFSKDGNTAVNNIRIGPLVWASQRLVPIEPLSVIGHVRNSPVECKINAHDTSTGLFRLWGVFRQMMREYGPESQPTVEITYEDEDRTCFSRVFTLSIDPFNKIVWEAGPVRVCAKAAQ